MGQTFSARRDGYAYADAGELIVECFRLAFAPPSRTSVADFAAENRWLANEGGGYVGRWSHAEVPYLVDVMDALTSPKHLTVCLVGPGQSAKTTVAENWLLQGVGCDPGGFLWYMQGKDASEAYVKTRINPMIAAHRLMYERLIPGSVNNSLDLKNFGSTTCEFLGASRSTLISKRAPRIILDELDAYNVDLGDVVDLADTRRQSYGRDSRVLAMSHCDRAAGLAEHKWTAGILALYRRSDRRLWYWPCAECGAWSSPHPLGRWHMAITYPDDATPEVALEAARLMCPHCGAFLPDQARRGMLRAGKWIGRGQEIAEDGTVTGELMASDVAGFWIVGAMSPFTWNGIGGLAESRVRARRIVELEGDASLREVMVKRWGLPYEPDGAVDAIDATTLADRADRGLVLGVVPHWCRFLTGMVDVQQNRFEILVRGWGLNGESAVVDMRRVDAEPATNPADWDALLKWCATAAYPLDDGTGRVMRVRAIGVDSGGPAGATEQAYNGWRRLRRERLVRPLGKVAGREAWSVLLLKGMSTLQAPRLAVTYPDSARKDRRPGARGEVPLGQHNPNVFKDAVFGNLAVVPPGAGAIHFPGELRGNWGAPATERTFEAPHVWFEQLVAEQRRKSGAWEQVKPHNEALDLMVGAHVMAHLVGLGRFDWERPPAWAAEWHANALVGVPDMAPRVGRATAPAAPAAPPAGAVQAPVPVPAAVIAQQTAKSSRAARYA